MAKTLNEWGTGHSPERGGARLVGRAAQLRRHCGAVPQRTTEALEEYRNGKPMIYGCCGHCDKETQCEVDGKPEHSCKPEGIATEMVDCLIRILDWCGKEGVDVEAVLAQKHEYNRTRQYRHGGKAL